MPGFRSPNDLPILEALRARPELEWWGLRDLAEASGVGYERVTLRVHELYLRGYLDMRRIRSAKGRRVEVRLVPSE
jgi:DNA-binding MarR family transcriptional regulator